MESNLNKIIEYLKNCNDWVSPHIIGVVVLDKCDRIATGIGMRYCDILVARGIAEKNELGEYRLVRKEE